MSLKNKDKIGFFRHTKVERVHLWQTYITGIVKGNPAGRKKMTLDGNLDLCKGMKSTRSDEYMVK